MNQDPIKSLPGAGAARFVGAVMGFVFAGVGVTVLVFMWGASSDEFGAPPLFFRIVASFIAIAFVAVGGGMGMAALMGGGGGGGAGPHAAGALNGMAPPSQAAGYKCPNCAAPLGEKADVSPSGDVKCAFCGRWFNVHRPGA